MEEKKEHLKICHVITRMIVGGAQENTLLTIKGHLASGHEVTLATGYSPGREGELLRNVKIEPFPVKIFSDLVRQISLWHDIRAFFKLKRFFREQGFDVVHTHSSKAGIIGRIAARSAGVPVVVHTVHGQAFHPYQNRLKNLLYIFLERVAAKYSDKIFAVAQAMIDQCVEAKIAPREKYQVVYSGMDTKAFATANRNQNMRNFLGIPPDALVIAVVARLFPQKGYEFVIPAAEQVALSAPDTHWLLIGDGPMYEQLQQKLMKNGLLEKFHFAGLIPPHEVGKYLAQADLLWHLSLHEGLPRAVVQALAVGIPAIGFALDGTPEVVINQKTGFVTEPGDIKQVAKLTLDLLKNDILRRQLGENGQKNVLEQFAWQRMADILETEYLKLVSELRTKCQN